MQYQINYPFLPVTPFKTPQKIMYILSLIVISTLFSNILPSSINYRNLFGLLVLSKVHTISALSLIHKNLTNIDFICFQSKYKKIFIICWQLVKLISLSLMMWCVIPAVQYYLQHNSVHGVLPSPSTQLINWNWLISWLTDKSIN